MYSWQAYLSSGSPSSLGILLELEDVGAQQGIQLSGIVSLNLSKSFDKRNLYALKIECVMEC